MAGNYRERLVLAGRVQGVGFRFYAYRVAEMYEVTGYVRNLPTGAVEVVAEGEKAEVEAFLAEVRKGPGYARVTEVKSYVEQPQGGYSSFGVEH